MNLVEIARRVFSIPRHEGHRGPLIEERHRGRYLFWPDGNFFGDALDELCLNHLLRTPLSQAGPAITRPRDLSFPD